MKTLTLELDESIYNRVVGFLSLLPKEQCHIIETPAVLPEANKPLTIKSAFGFVKISISTSQDDMDQDIPKNKMSARDKHLGRHSNTRLQ